MVKYCCGWESPCLMAGTSAAYDIHAACDIHECVGCFRSSAASNSCSTIPASSTLEPRYTGHVVHVYTGHGNTGEPDCRLKQLCNHPEQLEGSWKLARRWRQQIPKHVKARTRNRKYLARVRHLEQLKCTARAPGIWYAGGGSSPAGFLLKNPKKIMKQRTLSSSKARHSSSSWNMVRRWRKQPRARSRSPLYDLPVNSCPGASAKNSCTSQRRCSDEVFNGKETQPPPCLGRSHKACQ